MLHEKQDMCDRREGVGGPRPSGMIAGCFSNPLSDLALRSSLHPTLDVGEAEIMLSLTALAACLACADAHRDAHSYWTQPPVGWFGGNATHFENASQLEAIGKYNIAIFGWQHLIFATNWTASVYAQLSQAAILKAQQPHMSVYVYAGFANADGYNAATWEIIRSASDGCHGHQPCRKVAAPYTDWVLETDTTPVYSMSACEQMGLGYSNPPTFKCWNPIWNVANASMRDFFIEHVIAPLAAAPPTMVDGVFFDCFNEAYNMPTPWNRRATNIPNCTTGTGGSGCEALLAGTIDLARRVALTLNAGGKTPMFSNVGSFVNPKAGAPFWLDEGRLLDALDGTSFQLNYESVRAEKVPTPRFQPTTLQVVAHLSHQGPCRRLLTCGCARALVWYSSPRAGCCQTCSRRRAGACASASTCTSRPLTRTSRRISPPSSWCGRRDGSSLRRPDGSMMTGGGRPRLTRCPRLPLQSCTLLTYRVRCVHCVVQVAGNL